MDGLASFEVRPSIFRLPQFTAVKKPPKVSRTQFIAVKKPAAISGTKIPHAITLSADAFGLNPQCTKPSRAQYKGGKITKRTLHFLVLFGFGAER
ncbi:MAG: hypothetical protein LBU37_13155 [Tannerellaceae bacterium]|jgi:hypothetical protein|nr:hypothetical protein [Tannerellaceae bacterium]